jgi:two-component system, OmpR family, response regulator
MSEILHVLVVDDDGDVRDVIANFLLDAGYRVSLAKDGEAMRAFLETPDPVDLIVLDASMPGEPSLTLALHAKDRGTRLIMISGNPATMEAFHNRADQLLWKPFRQGDLMRAIEHALASETLGQRIVDPE